MTLKYEMPPKVQNTIFDINYEKKDCNTCLELAKPSQSNLLNIQDAAELRLKSIPVAIVPLTPGVDEAKPEPEELAHESAEELEQALKHINRMIGSDFFLIDQPERESAEKKSDEEKFEGREPEPAEESESAEPELERESDEEPKLELEPELESVEELEPELELELDSSEEFAYESAEELEQALIHINKMIGSDFFLVNPPEQRSEAGAAEAEAPTSGREEPDSMSSAPFKAVPAEVPIEVPVEVIVNVAVEVPVKSIEVHGIERSEKPVDPIKDHAILTNQTTQEIQVIQVIQAQPQPVLPVARSAQPAPITPAQTPTQAPTQTPTQAPTQTPTQAPTQARARAPARAPAQTLAPIQAAIPAPAPAPTPARTQAPALIPKKVYLFQKGEKLMNMNINMENGRLVVKCENNGISHHLFVRVRNNICEEDIKFPLFYSSKNRKVFLIAIYESNPDVKNNMLYFIKNGLVDDIDYIFIINGEISFESILPKNRHNCIVLHRLNEGFDFGAYCLGIQLLKFTKYDYYFFMNSSVRGPFLPEYIDERWDNFFIKKFRESVHLVSPTIINFLPDNKFMDRSILPDPNRILYPICQSYMFVIDHCGLEILNRYNFFEQTYETSFMKLCYKEVLLSAIILADPGRNIACLMPEFNGVNFNDTKQLDKLRSFTLEKGYNPIDDQQLFGRSMYPTDIIFHKTNRNLNTKSLESLTASKKINSFIHDSRCLHVPLTIDMLPLSYLDIEKEPSYLNVSQESEETYDTVVHIREWIPHRGPIIEDDHPLSHQFLKNIKDLMDMIPIDPFGGCSIETANYMVSLIYEYKLKYCVDIGTWRGRSIIPMIETCKLIDGFVMGVEDFSATTCMISMKQLISTTAAKKIMRWTLNMLSKHYHKKHYGLMKTTSDVAATRIKCREIDLLALDLNRDSSKNTLSDLYHFLPSVGLSKFIVLEKKASESVSPFIGLFCKKVYSTPTATWETWQRGYRQPLYSNAVRSDSIPIKFAIVMATYERADGKTLLYLNRSFKSIAAQSYDDWVLYLVGDDVPILDAWVQQLENIIPSNKIIIANKQSPERNYIKNKEKLWMVAGAGAMNYGLNMARYDGFKYYVHIDDDDYWDKNHLWCLANIYHLYPNCVFAYTRSTFPKNKEVPFVPFQNISQIYENNLLPSGCNVVHSAVSFRMDLIPFSYFTTYIEDEITGPVDALLWNKIKDFIIQDNKREFTAVYIPLCTCYHDFEGSSIDF